MKTTGSSSVSVWVVYTSLIDFVHTNSGVTAAALLVAASSIKSAQLGPHI